MRLAWILALACGCNQVFGVQRTELIDSPPPIDAAPPPMCPAIGTVPTFANELHQLPARYCFGYAASSDTQMATAMCDSVVAAGARDAELAPLTMTPPTSPGYVRIAPEGDRMFAGVYRTVSPYGAELREFALGADGATDLGVVFAYSDATYFTASTPTRGPEREAVLVIYDANLATTVLVEISDAGAGWKEKRRTPLDALGVSSVDEPNLSPDGLRLVFTSYSGASTKDPPVPLGDGAEMEPPTEGGQPDQPLYYADRASRADPFGMAQPLMTVPSFVQWPYMTEDCGRIYFSALNTVFYLRQ